MTNQPSCLHSHTQATNLCDTKFQVVSKSDNSNGLTLLCEFKLAPQDMTQKPHSDADLLNNVRVARAALSYVLCNPHRATRSILLAEKVNQRVQGPIALDHC